MVPRAGMNKLILRKSLKTCERVTLTIIYAQNKLRHITKLWQKGNNALCFFTVCTVVQSHMQMAIITFSNISTFWKWRANINLKEGYSSFRSHQRSSCTKCPQSLVFSLYAITTWLLWVPNLHISNIMKTQSSPLLVINTLNFYALNLVKQKSFLHSISSISFFLLLTSLKWFKFTNNKVCSSIP